MSDTPTYSPQTLVDVLQSAGHLNDERVRSAFLSVPRHIFLPDVTPEQAYRDQTITLSLDAKGRAVVADTMPSMVADLMDGLRLRDGLNVLHIGTGSGYSAALVKQAIGEDGRVTTIEIDRDVARSAAATLSRAGFSSVQTVHADGAEGYAPRAAYDRIAVHVGVWDIPPMWKRQIKPNGVICVPIWLDGLQVIAPFVLHDDGTLYAENIRPGAFVYIRGRVAMPQYRRRVGSTALTLLADDIEKLDMAALSLLLSQDQEAGNHLSLSLSNDDYWYGFLPYMVLHELSPDIFALYSIDAGRSAYGMTGEGFAYFTPASACFVPYEGLGTTHTFASADAFMEVERLLGSWMTAGRPRMDRLRLRLIPRSHGIPPDALRGKIYPRRDHFLHVWLESSPRS